MNVNDWQELMVKWNDAIFDSSLLTHIEQLSTPQNNLIQKRWLGRSGATEDELTTLEAKIGLKLPNSYRTFLQFSNGWQGALTYSIYELWSTREVDFLRVRNPDYAELWDDPHSPEVTREEHERYDETQIDGLFDAKYLHDAVEISDTGDSAIMFLNPKLSIIEGEWEAWFFANWYPGAIRYRSFAEMMVDQFNRFMKMQRNKLF